MKCIYCPWWDPVLFCTCPDNRVAPCEEEDDYPYEDEYTWDDLGPCWW